jgi:hypothetical protein
MKHWTRYYTAGILLAFLIFQPDGALSKDFLAHGSDHAIFLRWQRSTKEQAFNVYRKTDGGEYTKLNDQPIRPLRHRSDIVAVLGADTGRFLENFRVRFPEQIHEVLDRNPSIDVIAGALEPRLAVIRGDGFIDTTVVTGTRYSYKITEMPSPSATEEFLYADEINLTAESVRPLPPTNLSAKGGDFAILLFMEPPDTAGEGELGHNAGYDVFRSATRDGAYQKINPKRIFLSRSKGQASKPFPCYVDREVEIGRRYWYKAASVGILGTYSEPVGPVSAVALDRTPPKSPTITRIYEDTQKSLQIEWTLNDPKDLSGFNVYRSDTITDIGDRLNQKKLVGPSERSFQDQTPQKGRLYWYRVSSVDEYGNEGFSPPRKGARKSD